MLQLFEFYKKVFSAQDEVREKNQFISHLEEQNSQLSSELSVLRDSTSAIAQVYNNSYRRLLEQSAGGTTPSARPQFALPAPSGEMDGDAIVYEY